MSDIAIRVENLSKRYRIGVREKRANTLRETLGSLAASPFDYLRSTLWGPSEEEIIWPTPLYPPASRGKAGRGKAGRENIYLNGAIPSTGSGQAVSVGLRRATKRSGNR